MQSKCSLLNCLLKSLSASQTNLDIFRSYFPSIFWALSPGLLSFFKQIRSQTKQTALFPQATADFFLYSLAQQHHTGKGRQPSQPFKVSPDRPLPKPSVRLEITNVQNLRMTVNLTPLFEKNKSPKTHTPSTTIITKWLFQFGGHTASAQGLLPILFKPSGNGTPSGVSPHTKYELSTLSLTSFWPYQFEIMLKQALYQLQPQDLPKPTFCVSSNLSAGPQSPLPMERLILLIRVNKLLALCGAGFLWIYSHTLPSLSRGPRGLCLDDFCFGLTVCHSLWVAQFVSPSEWSDPGGSELG